MQFIEDHDISIACLCETWFDSQKGKFTARIKEAGFEIVHANRDDRRGGGVAILYKKSLRVKPGEESTTKFSSFEFAYCCIQASRSKIVLLCIYRLQEVKVAQDETDSFKKMLQKTTKFLLLHSQIHSEVKWVIKVSIDMEKFILRLANFFFRAITSKKCRSSQVTLLSANKSS